MYSNLHLFSLHNSSHEQHVILYITYIFCKICKSYASSFVEHNSNFADQAAQAYAVRSKVDFYRFRIMQHYANFQYYYYYYVDSSELT